VNPYSELERVIWSVGDAVGLDGGEEVEGHGSNLTCVCGRGNGTARDLRPMART
jgi:hypothetical protein